MGKRLVKPLLFLFVFLSTKDCCPQVNIDSLKNELNKLPATADNVRSIHKTASGYLLTDYTVCKAVNDILEIKARQSGSDTLLCRMYLYLAYANNDYQETKKATEFATRAHELALQTGRTDLTIRALGTLGTISRNSFQNQKAIEYHNKALALCTLPEYNILKATILGNIGLAYATFPNPDETKNNQALKYTKEAFELARSINHTDEIILQGIHLGDRYRMLGKEDSGIIVLKSIKHLIPETNYRRLEQYHNNLALNYCDLEKYDEGIEELKLSLNYKLKLKTAMGEALSYFKLHSVYELKGDYQNSMLYYKKYMDTKHTLENKRNTESAIALQNKYEQALKDNEINKLKSDQALKDLELEKQKAVIAGNLLEAEKRENEIRRLQTEDKIRQLELEKQKAVIAGNILEAKRKEDEIKLLSQEKKLQDLQLIQQSDLLAKNMLQAKADSQQIQLVKQQTILKEKQIRNQTQTRNYLVAGLGLLVLISFILYRNIMARKKAYTKLEEKSLHIKEQALQLGRQAKQIAQFQSQMNPHFVYNALHNIQGLVLTDEKQKANTQIQSLAQLMRKTFANAEKDDIPVEEEINYLQKYIDFEKAAFGANLSFEVNVAKEAEGALIPPMMIQPFIENAIKHAELKKVENPYIKVLIETENNLLAINVKDNGTGIKKDAAEADKLSHSMSVIKSRLDLIFKGRADVNNQPVFSIKTVPELPEGTSIKFYLPLNYSY